MDQNSRKQYNMPLQSEYLGNSFWYRIENRGGIKTLIVSYRKTVNKRMRIVFESGPRTNKKIREWISQLDMIDNKDTALELLDQDTFRSILNDFLSLEKEKIEKKIENVE